MTEYDLEWWKLVFDMIGHLALVVAGLVTLAMAWKSPAPGSMPIVLSKSDKTRDDGIRNIRHVFLTFVGFTLIATGAWGLI